MSHLLDEILAQAANGDPITATLSAESVAVAFFGSEFLERRENWLDRGYDPLDEVSDSDWDAIEKLVGNLYSELMTNVTLPYPEVFEISTLGAIVTVGTSLIRTIASGQLFNGGIEVSPAALNNKMTLPFYGRKGYYNLTVLGIVGTNYGIFTANITDGALSPTNDWYAAAGASNVKKTYGVDVPYDGLNYLTMAVGSRHVSSTGYRGIFSQFLMQRTGD